MAIGVSPQRLREVRFAEQWRGYRTDEVDELVDRTADAIDLLEDCVRDATARAAEAERLAQERNAGDELSRTLVLAQRTADAAVREAEAEAARLVTEAEERAQVMMAEVDGRVARLETEIEARAEVELRDLHERRRNLEADVELLAVYVERHRAYLAAELRQHLDWLEAGDHLEAAPVLSPLRTVEQYGDDAPVVPGPLLGEDVPAPFGTGRPEPSPFEEDSVDRPDPPDERAADACLPHTDHVVGDDADDPFIAELRRAVDDPEPLGPRDETRGWDHGADRYNPDLSNNGRFRRRRHR